MGNSKYVELLPMRQAPESGFSLGQAKVFTAQKIPAWNEVLALLE